MDLYTVYDDHDFGWTSSYSRELYEASEVDGASRWRQFLEITFPLMLPVSITAVLIRIIFKLKLADIIINITSGGQEAPQIALQALFFVNIETGRMSVMVLC